MTAVVFTILIAPALAVLFLSAAARRGRQCDLALEQELAERRSNPVPPAATGGSNSIASDLISAHRAVGEAQGSPEQSQPATSLSEPDHVSN